MCCFPIKVKAKVLRDFSRGVEYAFASGMTAAPWAGPDC